MKRSYKILRAVLVIVLLGILLAPAALYVFMATPYCQNTVKKIGQDELSRLLGTEVIIGSVSFTPYNKITLRDVLIIDDKNDTAAYIRRLGAGIDLNRLLFDKKISVNYTELIGLDARICKQHPDSVLNIQSIIAALTPKDKTKPPAKFDLSVNNIVIRRSAFSYDILSEPIDSARFDRNHVKIYDFNADIRMPRIKNDDFIAEVKRFTITERSGLCISNLCGNFHISSSEISARDFSISLPNSSLSLSNFDFRYQSWNDLKSRLNTIPVDIEIMQGSYVSTSDFCGLAPQFCGLDAQLDIVLDIEGTLDSLSVKRLDISSDKENICIYGKGQLNHLTNKDSLSADISMIHIHGYGTDIADLCSMLGNVNQSIQKNLTNLGRISVDGNLSANMFNGHFNGSVSSAPGNIGINLFFNRHSLQAPFNINGKVSSANYNVGKLISNDQIGSVGLIAEYSATIDSRLRSATIDANVTHAEFKGYRYNNLNAIVNVDDNKFDGSLNIVDSNIELTIAGEAILNDNIPEIDLHIEALDIALDRLNLWNKYPGYRLSASIDAIYSGSTFDDATALLTINNLKYLQGDTLGLSINSINMDMDNTTSPQHIIVNSDMIDGRIDGEYDPKTLVSSIRDIFSHSFPIINTDNDVQCKSNHENATISNDFKFDFVVKDNNQLTDFIKSPVKLIHPIYITGYINHSDHKINLDIDAPYLDQNYKLIKNSALRLDVNANDDLCRLYATTTFPTKNGDAEIKINCDGKDNRLNTDVSWKVLRERDFNGNVNLSTFFEMLSTGEEQNQQQLRTDISINPSQMIFNDTIWTINPASIVISGEEITVDGFDVRRDNQYITMNGKASPNPEDEILLKLLNVNLDYVFETLAINNVMFGGDATGTFIASNLFSKEPRLSTPGLSVKGLSYNHAVLGDAIIESKWNPDEKAVTINADISQYNGRKSYIDGAIFPMNDSLDFNFKADKINVAFMRPFMEAFAKDVTGYASGDARLWGNFKYIDMTGDIFAEDLKLKIDFTNTYYTATDSVHLKPGYIEFDDIDLYDMYGNKAKLGGYLKHYCFKRPEYRFSITDAYNFLSYDEVETRNPLWYGRIFGNGKATVTGVPGAVKIEVNMTTAPKSTFTFVLSDAEEASEYNFITFRDKAKINTPVDSALIDPRLEKVKNLERIIAERKRQDYTPTKYLMDIQVEARPEAEMILVMDPIGGDRIRAHGTGNLNLIYASDNEDLHLSGTYTLQDGKYNFTLQDIIIKDFVIKEGSSIVFEGDPLAAKLGINAIYPLNANLSDLDESFLQDTDLNRTNVPVHALMEITGDMREPEIKFDLEFPTLSQDVYRKVKSIVSTDDMMNRQILYLLALNRFYTPEYMASTTKGNELVSVAASTISSQFSNILSELSENWNISPTFRSDKGDFSDVEVDLALSSRLLNNRLLFNGNFGYRDKTMNNNSFIGDFDIEYLLNRTGNIRLKAYNRYNDQNYYLKTALTTQGVGIVFKRDFDKLFSFLRPKKKHKTEDSDSTTAVTRHILQVTDSITPPPIIIPQK